MLRITLNLEKRIAQALRGPLCDLRLCDDDDRRGRTELRVWVGNLMVGLGLSVTAERV